jgi:alpha-galactosidase
MGWNSWDSYGTTVREAQVKANADWMDEHLAKYGWLYIVIDIQWYEPNAQGHDNKPGAPLTMDDYGRLIPALNRFPSSANGAGFKPQADYIHGKGLKFGIHIMRGIPRQAVDNNLPIKDTQYHAPTLLTRTTAAVGIWTCGASILPSPEHKHTTIRLPRFTRRGALTSSRLMIWEVICTGQRR